MSVVEIRNIMGKITRCSECSAEEVDKWMTCDSLERGFQILSDDEIQSTKELISDLKEDDDDDISIEL
ncbi:hypothetical protein CEXT_23121 [Caerostris extrusa]|uniref:Uncharacterized protein n=1 Tax=Caerostris extrusa TaxID=172846 RepID=A0AAV4WJT4_CAEEX|nr:hypothetical protein CEXT_23121 [Caerostris extrusa]